MHRAYVLTRYVLSEDGTDNGSFVDGFAFCVLLLTSRRFSFGVVPTWTSVGSDMEGGLSVLVRPLDDQRVSGARNVLNRI